MYISLWENYRGHPDNISFMQFSTKIDGFEQKDSQGFENSYNSYEQYPLEKFFIFTIYQNYTLALKIPGAVLGKLPLGTIPHRIKIKSIYCPPGPQSLGLLLLPTRPILTGKTTHQDQYLHGGELSWWGVVRIPSQAWSQRIIYC